MIITCGKLSTQLIVPKVKLNNPDAEYEIIMSPISVFLMRNFYSTNNNCPIKEIEIIDFKSSAPSPPRIISKPNDELVEL